MFEYDDVVGCMVHSTVSIHRTIHITDQRCYTRGR